MVGEEEYVLANQEILGGLKSAISRGETLKKAMMTFYQSGYGKEEIEKAAKAYLYLKEGVSEVGVLKKEEERKKLEEKKSKKNELLKKNNQEVKKKKGIFSFIKKTKLPEAKAGVEIGKQKKEVIQKISNYSPKKEPPKNPKKMITLVLVVALASLLGILAAVFLFKEELIIFFNNLFG